jgi:hypothetical protein
MRVIVALALAVVVVAGCSSRAAPTAVAVHVTPSPTVARTPRPTPIVHTITGTFDLIGTYPGADCAGTGGYDDIREGTGVTLRDRQSSVIAIATLGAGEGLGGSCRFVFTFPGVPEIPAYTIEVSHRGGITKSLADLRADGWNVALQLGGY